MVTHDQEEALTMADKIVVMRNAMIEQIGTPQEIYNNPKTVFVANFIGTMNIYRKNRNKLYGVRPENIGVSREMGGNGTETGQAKLQRWNSEGLSPGYTASWNPMSLSVWIYRLMQSQSWIFTGKTGSFSRFLRPEYSNMLMMRCADDDKAWRYQ